MKQKICFGIAVLSAMILCACEKGEGSHINVINCESEIYTEDDIEEAISVTEEYFKEEFQGCTLTEIGYAGDDVSAEYQDWADRNEADEVIVLISSFDVDLSCEDGSFNKGSTYEDWNWILVRTAGGKWQHVDHGY